jgi:hypothetical protein
MCTLLAFVDDATSRLMPLRFVAFESAFDYFRATKDYLETHCKPVAFYRICHTMRPCQTDGCPASFSG